MTYIILLVPLDQFARQSRFVVFALRCRGRRSSRDLGKLLLLLLLEVAPQDGAHLAVAEDLGEDEKTFFILVFLPKIVISLNNLLSYNVPILKNYTFCQIGRIRLAINEIYLGNVGNILSKKRSSNF